MSERTTMKTKKTKTKSFSRLTAAQKRVAIARDVISQIRLGNIKMMRGHFARIRKIDNNKNASYCQRTLQKGLRHCTACAVGAGIVCAIRRFNKLDIPLVDTPHPMGEFFQIDQVRKIELAFEAGLGWYRASNGPDGKAVEFGYRFANESDRAIAIYKNIIAHNGKFVP